MANLSDFEKESLDRHNELRKLHGSHPLEWSEELSATALSWAKEIASKRVMNHSNTKNGENLAYLYNIPCTGTKVSDMWYSEIKDYDFSNPVFNSATGHFTQLVWANSKYFGIAHFSNNKEEYIVAHYSPPGNFVGKFDTNVFRLQTNNTVSNSVEIPLAATTAETPKVTNGATFPVIINETTYPLVLNADKIPPMTKTAEMLLAMFVDEIRTNRNDTSTTTPKPIINVENKFVDIEKALIAYHNDTREKIALPPLETDPELDKLAWSSIIHYLKFKNLMNFSKENYDILVIEFINKQPTFDEICEKINRKEDNLIRLDLLMSERSKYSPILSKSNQKIGIYHITNNKDTFYCSIVYSPGDARRIIKRSTLG